MISATNIKMPTLNPIMKAECSRNDRRTADGFCSAFGFFKSACLMTISAPFYPESCRTRRCWLSSSRQRCIHNRQLMPLCHKMHLGNSKYPAQFLGRHLHRPWRRCSAWGWLRESRRHRGVKGRIAFDLLHDLMDVPVQYCDGTEPLEKGECLFTVRCSPTPVRINSPQRNMCKEHDRRTVLVLAQIFLQPVELRRPEFPHAFQLNYIHQADEVHAFVIEAVPSISGRTFAIPLKVKLSIVDRSVMLARDIKYLPFGARQYLVHRVEFTWLGSVC